LSIIIVGVGQEDFSAMEELDSDDALLSHNGKTAKRDIVQFVEMQKFVSGVGTHRLNWNKEHLAREVLFEIPEQLVGYMKSKNFKPVGARRSQQSSQQSSQHPAQRYQSPPPAYTPF